MAKFIFLTIASVVCCLALSCSKPTEKADLILLHTGRLRGNVYPDNLSGIAPLQYYQYIAGYVKKTRDEAKKSGGEVVLIDLGDSLSGSFASFATDGKNVQTFFNELGYDAVMLGNLDGELRPELIADLKMPVLCPFETSEGKPAMPGTKSFVEIRKGTSSLQVLPNFYGDVDPNAYPERFPVSFGGISPVRPIRDYGSLAAQLPPKTNNTLRLLGWLKFEAYKKTPVEFIEALKSSGIDAIAAHRIYSSGQKDVWTNDSLVEWAVPVSQNILRDNRGFSLARLDLKKTDSGWKVLKHELVPMTANQAPADASIAKAVQPFAQKIQSADEVLLELKEDVDSGQILKMFLAALASVPETDAAIYSPASIRTDWSRGKLRASRVYDSIPWPNKVVKLTLTPEQFAAVRERKKFAFLVKSNLDPTKPVSVTTSQFFAKLITEQFDLPADAIHPVSDELEFQFFNRALKANASAPTAPIGWSYDTEPGA